ncbi:uncharacterized protein LOC131935291 isoform X1 [Physella acuta]|uniref:uncharacterized protein LOC131935291 isoform X1 n=1 Tax=Physella acuta TaxID=109671 RepID=UPI0027DBCC73|nr:uncharacterized protein LOC131935291 isoform X1 [Physella acuta]XP_059147663.1 uncharacterized protein LOC131935291 isoform X1 [Physella acuta]
MNQVISFSILLFCVISLTDAVNGKHVFNLTIEGYEKDCVNYSCRYTGKVLASFSSTPEITKFGFQDCMEVTIYSCPQGKDCGDNSWEPYCFVFDYPCEGYKCNKVKHPCYCTYGNPTKIKFFPVHENRLYQMKLKFLFDTYRDIPMLIASGNIFDFSKKPDNWDPIEKYPDEPFYYFSKNGNHQLKAELIVIGIGALFAFYLAKQMECEKQASKI